MNSEFLRDKKIYLATTVAILLLFFIFSISTPVTFPSKSFFSVSEGIGLHSLSLELEDAKIIRSPFWFRLFAITLGGERDMKAGDYYMAKPENSFVIAWRIFHGDYDIETIKITIPEGFSVKKISTLFDEKFPIFDNELFESLAEEGYMFPDTYFIPVATNASSTVKMFRDNFDYRLEPFLEKINSSGRSMKEIITMASILEGEARGSEDMKIVSGILWKRIEKGIALQVDTTFAYINGKGTKDLTKDDLKINSPFNTYLYKGLPPTPISNPGLVSIEAALSPTASPYLYFLTGDDGEMYYSRTFDEHVEKKLKYIK